MKNEQNTVKATKGSCVVCSVETEYTFGALISENQYYVESVGQLCQKCHYDLYVKRNGGVR